MIINITIGSLLIVLLWVVYSYNRLVLLVNRTTEAWSGIDVQLKRRYDLIPNLVNIVKRYSSHESAAFENVSNARTAAIDSVTPQAKGEAEVSLAESLSAVFAVAEAYPELKANQNYLDLQSQLSEIENNIQMARRYYNGNVRELNNRIQIFPGNIVAVLFRFSSKEFFQTEELSKKPVEVKF